MWHLYSYIFSHLVWFYTNLVKYLTKIKMLNSFGTVTLQDGCSLNPNRKAPIIGMYPPSSVIFNPPTTSNFLSLLKIPKFEKATQGGSEWVRCWVTNFVIFCWDIVTQRLSSTLFFRDVRQLLTIMKFFNWSFISVVFEDGKKLTDYWKSFHFILVC